MERIYKKLGILPYVLVVVAVLTLVLISLNLLFCPNYAKDFSKVFGSYEIELVDKMLDENTLITYKGNTATYHQLRANVIDAFEKKDLSFGKYSSYGGREINNLTSSGFSIESFPKYQGLSYEIYVEMEIEHRFFNYSVVSISSDSDLFGYLFFEEVF